MDYLNRHNRPETVVGFHGEAACDCVAGACRGFGQGDREVERARCGDVGNRGCLDVVTAYGQVEGEFPQREGTLVLDLEGYRWPVLTPIGLD